MDREGYATLSGHAYTMGRFNKSDLRRLQADIAIHRLNVSDILVAKRYVSLCLFCRILCLYAEKA